MFLFEKIEEIAKGISRRLLDHGQIEKEDFDLYVYGFREGIIQLLNLFTALLIGLVFWQFWENVIFLLSYTVLRKYAGGYHASSREGCFIRSMALITAVMAAIKWIHISMAAGMIISMVALVVTCWLSPIENVRRPVDAEEKKLYGRLSKAIILMEVGVIALLYRWQRDSFAQSVMWGICSASALQLVVYVQGLRKRIV